MSKLKENLRIAIESSARAVKKVAVYYQSDPIVAQKIAELLPYPTVVVDCMKRPLPKELCGEISHGIELSHPAEKGYDLCRRQRQQLIASGCLILSLYDWQEYYLEDDFWGNTNYLQLPALLEGIKRDLEKVTSFRITSALGTDISFSVKGRRWIVANGICREDELSQMPDGEIYTCPVEESFTGTLVVDGTITRSWLPSEPQRLEFEQGRLVHASAAFAEYIRPKGPDIYLIGEFALGFNPDHHHIVHNISVDEKAAGTVHFALGDSYNLGKNHCQCHLDMVIREPKITTDPLIDLPFFRKGRF